MGKVLFVATVVRLHINMFHKPFIKWFHDQGCQVDVAANNDYENKNECRYKLDSIQELDSYGEQLNFVLNNYLNPPKIESISTDYIFTKWGKYPRPDHYVPFLKYGLPSDEKHTS